MEKQIIFGRRKWREEAISEMGDRERCWIWKDEVLAHTHSRARMHEKMTSDAPASPAYAHAPHLIAAEIQSAAASTARGVA